jgi:phosphatidylglycerol---prolipoprotein diacylglyceryl transferase
MLPVINLGPLAIHAPGMILLFGIWAALYAAEHRAAGSGIDSGWLSNSLLIGLAGGIVIARVAFVLPAAAAYVNDPWALIRPELNSFDPVWGVVGGGLIIVYRFQRRGLLTLTHLAVLAPALAILYAAGGLADLAAGTRYGLPSTLPWAIPLWDEHRHPTQIYRLLGAGVTGGIWLFMRRRLAAAHQLRLVAALLAATTLISDGFVADGAVLPGGIRVSQAVAWLLLATAWPAPQRPTATVAQPTASQS